MLEFVKMVDPKLEKLIVTVIDQQATELKD